MELRHLRYFRAVAEIGNFTRAARRLRVAQSALSVQIRDLEEELGFELFDRDSRQISLTAAGTQFLKDATTILADVEDATKRAQDFAEGLVGEVNIGFVASTTAVFLPKLIKEFSRKHADIRLLLNEFSPSEQFEAIINHKMDCGFSRPHQSSVVCNIEELELFSDSLFAVVPKGSKLYGRKYLKPADIDSHKLFVYDRVLAPELFSLIERYLTNEKLYNLGFVDSRSVQALLALVEAGQGVGVVPGCVRWFNHRGVRFIPLVGASKMVPLVFQYPAKALSPASHLFVEWVKSNAKAIRAACQKEFC